MISEIVQSIKSGLSTIFKESSTILHRIFYEIFIN